MSEKCACARAKSKLDDVKPFPVELMVQSGCFGHELELQLEYIRVHDDCSCRAKEEEDAKEACERAKDAIDELICNPIEEEVGSGRLRDVMEAENNYFRVHEGCSCRSNSDPNDSLITHVDSEEEPDEDDERNVEEEEDDDQLVRGEKRVRSDDGEEDENDKRLRIDAVSFELWAKGLDPTLRVPLE